MRFPHYLFGFPMTAGLWYVVIIVGAIIIFWILQKVFSNLVKDFAGGALSLSSSLSLFLLAISLVSGSDTISNGFDIGFKIFSDSRNCQYINTKTCFDNEQNVDAKKPNKPARNQI